MKTFDKVILLKTIILGVLFLGISELVLFGISSFEKETTINSLYPKSAAIDSHIDSVFQSSITISDSYQSFLISDFSVSKENTEVFLDYLFTYDETYIKNIAVLEDTTIKFNYPFEGNESSIGIDLALIDGQKQDVLYVKEQLKPVFVGPVDLVQGGSAFILRIPVLDDNDYWGQISVVIDADMFMTLLLDEVDKNEINIIIVDNTTNSNIFKSGEIHEDESVSFTYKNKYINWNIVISQQEKSVSYLNGVTRRIISFLLITLICTLIYKGYVLNKEIRYNAQHDSLSGNYNRSMFISDYNSGMFNGMLIAFADVNKFKLINDTLGHSFGDWCLIQLSEQFESFGLFRTYRISGDEFILVSKSPMKIKRLKETLSSNGFSFYNEELKQHIDIDLSIGILEKLTPKITLESILMYLDYAMYDAKKEGKIFTIVDQDLMRLYDETKIIEQRLIDDIKNNRLIPYYHPIINLRTKRIEGFEVLSRWVYNGKLQPAAVFINVVKKIKYVDLVDINLFNKLQTEYIEMKEQLDEIKDLSFSVNLSAESLMIFERNNKKFDQFIKDRVIDNSKIVFEISEDMNLGLISMETLRYIQSKGFSISVDDFGAGVSKLSDVLSGELGTIKTDKSLLPSLKSDGYKIKGFNTIIKAIKSSGNSICVEGVETSEQLALSKEVGCNLAQGYLFSKPIPKEEVIDFVKNFNYSNYIK